MKSYSLHIGINSVDSNHYNWDGALHGCVNDAQFYQQLATREQCQKIQLLISTDSTIMPTSQNVLGYLDAWGKELVSGDNLFITYSGHGGVLEDKNFDESDFQDETWCLYDRQLLDDEIALAFSKFSAGVRIYMISDSCHSGTIAKSGGSEVKADTSQDVTSSYLRRLAPREKLFETYNAHKDFYSAFMKLPIVRDTDIKASVLQLGACQDDESAMESGSNGLFTSTIMKILQKNGEISSYQELLIRTQRALGGIQRPNLFSYGVDHQLLARTKPFGSGFVEGSSKRIRLFDDKGSLRIESNNPAVSLDTMGGFIISKVLPKPGNEGFVVYECSAVEKDPDVYPWDNAYRQYGLLKEKGFPVTCVEPEIILHDALEGEAQPVSATGPITVNQRLLGLLFSRMFYGKVMVSRGVGKAARSVEDEVLLTMMGLETVYLLTKDEELKPFSEMSIIDLQKHLSSDENYNAFTKLLKGSIYSSNYLTAHL